VKSRTRAFSFRSSSMCAVSLSDVMPAAAVSVFMLPKLQACDTARTVAVCPTAYPRRRPAMPCAFE
jgi:hypothetical protein